MKTVQIYCDGACEGNHDKKGSRIGGYGIVIKLGDKQKEFKGHALETTNNQMELEAAITALTLLKEPCNIELHTDSNYVVRGMTEWMIGWKRRNWKSSTGETIKNKEHWQRLDEISTKHTVSFNWVKGHNGHPENERADELAQQAIDEYKATK